MLDPLHPLFSAIIDIVAHRTGVTMKELSKDLRARRMPVSVPTLYRTVGQMISAGVLIRDEGSLAFAPTWLSEQRALFGKAPATAKSPVVKKEVLPKVQDRSASLLKRTVRKFIGERMTITDLVSEDR